MAGVRAQGSAANKRKRRHRTRRRDSSINSAGRRTASRLQPIRRRLDPQRVGRHHAGKQRDRWLGDEYGRRLGIIRAVAEQRDGANVVGMPGVIVQRQVQLLTCREQTEHPDERSAQHRDPAQRWTGQGGGGGAVYGHRKQRVSIIAKSSSARTVETICDRGYHSLS